MVETLEPPFNCPHCNHRIERIDEVATVGGIGNLLYPHSTCPECKKCMGCPSPILPKTKDQVDLPPPVNWEKTTFPVIPDFCWKFISGSCMELVFKNDEDRKNALEILRSMRLPTVKETLEVENLAFTPRHLKGYKDPPKKGDHG